MAVPGNSVAAVSVPAATLSELNSQRRRAVQLRVDGRSLSQIQGETGLSVPTAMALDNHGDIYVSDLGAAPPGAGRILRFSNPTSGNAITTVEVRKPAPLKDCDSDDEDGHH